jgi:hypothetical protein
MHDDQHKYLKFVRKNFSAERHSEGQPTVSGRWLPLCTRSGRGSPRILLKIHSQLAPFFEQKAVFIIQFTCVTRQEKIVSKNHT